jgi:UDP-glucuronate decarboxylase
LRGQDLTVYGDGQQTRSFCYVDDLIDGLMRLMDLPAKTEGVTGPVNLGNPGEFTIRELAEQVLAMTGSTSRLTFMPLPQDDPRQRRPDISLAGRLLGWAPKVALADGLPPTIENFKEQLRLLEA